MRWLENNLLSGCQTEFQAQPFWYSDHKLVARDKTWLVKNHCTEVYDIISTV